MPLKTWRFFCSLASLTGLLLSGESANAYPACLVLPLPPRFSANGYIRDYAVGKADLMLPVRSDVNHNLYLNPSVGYASDEQGYADLGLGYRWMQNASAIWGVYLFGGYSRIENHARLWVLNPGIEALGSRWDARLNGYFPMGDRNKTLGYATSSPYFSGHSKLNTLSKVVQHAGDGADIKLAYQIVPRVPLTGYLGSYFFSPSSTSKIWGGATGLEYWVHSNVKVFAGYSYDNLVHSTAALGVGVEFGGTHKHHSDPSVAERITDPVERYLAKLGRGSGIPSRNRIQNVTHVLLSNIAFFSQNGGPNNGGLGLSLQNCTFENPCGPTDLTNASAITLSSLLPNTMLWFNGGAYNALNIPGGSNGVTLQPGQGVYSRTPDYTQAATGTQRSTFNGAFNLNSNNSLNNIILMPTPATIATGITTLAGATNFLINGSQIGSTSNPFDVGVNTGDGSTGVINNSQIFANDTGIGNGGNVMLTLANSGVNTVGDGDTLTVYGILAALPNTSITIVNSQVNSTSFPGVTVGGSAIGIASEAAGNIISVSNSTISATGTGHPDSAVTLISTSGGAIQVNQGTLTATAPFVLPTIRTGTNITISPSTVCTINGGQVVC